MTGIIGLSALLIVLGLSLVITRVATISLMYTGLSAEAARFQARSVFTGTGFTTEESESVMNHPVRRRIVMVLMLLRSAGIITILLSLILSFMGTDDPGRLIRLAWLAGGVALLWAASRSRSIDRAIHLIMQRAARKTPDLEIIDYTALLRLAGNYVIRELAVEEDDWIANRKLSSCSLREEGVEVIGIHRSNGDYVGVPRGDSEVYPGDRLVLYGRQSGLHKLDERRKGSSGDREHDQAVDDESRRMEQQKQDEKQYDSEQKNEKQKEQS